MTSHAPILDKFAVASKTYLPPPPRDDRRVTKNASPALRNLARNLEAHLKGVAVKSEFAVKAGMDVKTLGRMASMQNEPQLDKVSGLAKAMGKEPWEVIHPDGGLTKVAAVPTAAEALDVLADAFAQIPRQSRNAAAGMLAAFAISPDSSLNKKDLLALLEGPERGVDATDFDLNQLLLDEHFVTLARQVVRASEVKEHGQGIGSGANEGAGASRQAGRGGGG